jgi:uncharacterized protein YecE (DUF72 family)
MVFEPSFTASTPKVSVGTSGFAYPEWRGSFYPEKLPAKQFLAYYARYFTTTEVNNTFYRFPRANVTEAWGHEVPSTFAFTLKLSQRITHAKRLKDVDREMGWFMDGALALGEKLGPILVQLPPNFRKDVERLDAYLAKHAPRARLAIEFRHDSWYDEAVYEVLRKHRAALVVVQLEAGEGESTPRVATGDFTYLRLRKLEYTDAELQDWAEWIRAQEVDAFCYFKHDDIAPLFAQRLMRLLDLPITEFETAAPAAAETAEPGAGKATKKVVAAKPSRAPRKTAAKQAEGREQPADSSKLPTSSPARRAAASRPRSAD